MNKRQTIYFLLSCILMLLFVLPSEAQIFRKKKKKSRELRTVDAPELTQPIADSLQPATGDSLLNVPEKLAEGGADGEDDFAPDDLKKELALVAEDTAAVIDSTALVEVAEKLLIAKDWVSLYEYYTTWDSYNINPYKIDLTKFADSVGLQLYQDSSEWRMPLAAMEATSDFGFRRYRWHYGVDLRLSTGDSVLSMFDGIVRIKKYDPSGYGYYLLVRHKNGLETLYGHLSEQLVNVGDEVKAGDLIGYGGSTGRSSGPHLHLELRYMGGALNPSEFINFEEASLLSDSVNITSASFAYLKEARKVYYHRIRRGETLSHVSRKYGVSLSRLYRMNGLNRRSVLRIGQRIRIR